MKKRLLFFLILCLVLSCGLAQGQDVFSLWFEDGFRLDLPEGWVYYPVDTEAAQQGVRYLLGDGLGERFLYIQRRETALPDAEALNHAIEARTDWEKTGNMSLGGQAFTAFVIPAANVSGCATLYQGDLLLFLFTCQDDSAYMLTVTQIMQSFYCK